MLVLSEQPATSGWVIGLTLLSQHEGYVLQRLRAQPGQKLLAGYQPASGSGSFTKDSLYPQARVRNEDPGRAANLASQPPDSDSRPPADPEELPVPELHATPQAVAAAAPGMEPDAQPSGAAHAFRAVQPAICGSLNGMLPTDTAADPAEQPRSSTPETPQASMPQAHQLDASIPPADLSHDGFELSLQLPADEECAAAPHAPAGPSAAEVATAAYEPSLQQEQQPICPGPQDTRRLPRAEAPPALIADDTGLAQQVRAYKTQHILCCNATVDHPYRKWSTTASLNVQVAAQKRGACDVLKGPPRSSRDDPEFMNTFFKASRLHFIGTWKARPTPACMHASLQIQAHTASSSHVIPLQQSRLTNSWRKSCRPGSMP